MICVIETPADVANLVELHNLVEKGKRKGKDPEKNVSAWAWADFHNMVVLEKLYLLAHSDGVKIGGLTVEAMAAGLIDKKLPKWVPKIVLVACNTGVKFEGEKTLCEQLSDALEKKQKTYGSIKVTGFTGSAVTNKMGQTRAVDKILMRKYAKEYNSISERWADRLEGYEKDAKLLPCKTPEELISSGAKMACSSKEFFNELYTINKKIVKSKAGSKVYSVKKAMPTTWLDNYIAGYLYALETS